MSLREKLIEGVARMYEEGWRLVVYRVPDTLWTHGRVVDTIYPRGRSSSG